MNETTPCLIWGTQAKELSVGLRDGASIDSPRAGGPYFVSGIAAALLQRTTEREKARLTSWLVEQRRLGEDTPEVTTKTLEDVERRPSLSVHERADRLLKSISLELDDIRTCSYTMNMTARTIHYTAGWHGLSPYDPRK